MSTLISRAHDRLLVARHILTQLELIQQWNAFGKPVLVGAAAYGLLVTPDIDLEIYCDELHIEDGFEVLRACAINPHVHSARFSNQLHGPDMGLYWQLRYLDEDGLDWKIDMWSVHSDHPGPTSAALVEPMKSALTPETRQAILEIKEQALLDATLHCPSIHIYRAVLDDGVRSLEQLKAWLAHHPPDGLTDWKPGPPNR